MLCAGSNDRHEQQSCLTVRVTVKLRPDEHDELFHHVCRIGSTMSAFLRKSAVSAIKKERPVAFDPNLSSDITSARLEIATEMLRPHDPRRNGNFASACPVPRWSAVLKR
jgi:hypothetical protein